MSRSSQAGNCGGANENTLHRHGGTRWFSHLRRSIPLTDIDPKEEEVVAVMAAASPPTPTTSSSPQVRQLVLHQMLRCALLLLPGVVKSLKWWSAQSPLP